MKIHLAVAAAMTVKLVLSVPYTFTITSPQQQQLNIISSRSPQEIENLIIETANSYGIDEEKFLSVAKCESSLQPEVIGDSGNSVGLFQIHLPSHPGVTKALAADPLWASEWAANKWAEGKASMWTCARLLGYTK